MVIRSSKLIPGDLLIISFVLHQPHKLPVIKLVMQHQHYQVIMSTNLQVNLRPGITIIDVCIFLFFVFFFQGDHTLSRKKNCPENPHSTGTLHCRATQCKQAPHTPLLNKSGKGRHVYVRARPRPSRSAWAENIANAWLPYTNIWGNT